MYDNMMWWICNHERDDAEHCTKDAAVSQLARLPGSRNRYIFLFRRAGGMDYFVAVKHVLPNFNFVISCVRVCEDS